MISPEADASTAVLRHSLAWPYTGGSDSYERPDAIYIGSLKYIDETAEVAATYGQDEGEPDLDDGQPQEPQQEHDQEVDIPQQCQSAEADAYQLDPDLTSTNGGDDLHAGFQHPSTTSFSTTDAIDGPARLGDPLWQSSVNEQPTSIQSSRIRAGSGSQSSVDFSSPNQSRSLGGTSPQSSLLSGLVKAPSNHATQTANSELEVALLRYFIDVLACCFDICDPEKHFALIVPHRARWCPPLKNAILAASARHLTRVCNPTSKPDFLYFHADEAIPNLTEETALHYHSQCIKDLLQRSMDAEQTQDASLLAAAIILRFYEEIDAPLREDSSDNELFLRVINVFIDAQIPAVPVVPHSSPVIGPEIATDQYGSLLCSSQVTHSPTASSHVPGVNDPPSHWRTDGLRQAGFWVAFRQEIHSAFLKQRPFHLSLSRCEAFRCFSPAEDAIWADRLVVFCADVLDYCYDNQGHAPRHRPNQTLKDRWLDLKHYEQMWGEVLPASFEPIYFRDPDRSKGEVFPHICYMIDCHAVGVQYIELARILLTVYDPTRPMLGPGYATSMRALAVELKAAVLRLCGIAVSNRKCPPALANAFLGIVMCGDHFEDPLEQEALLGFLDKMEAGYGWPAGDTRQTLKESWGKA